MSKLFKIVLISGFLTGTMLFAFADRGFNKKAKKKVTLNVPTNNNFKKALSVNLKSGLKYTGSLISVANKNAAPVASNLVTYQKGNTIYIVPYKQKIIVPEVRQGYTGMKLIIKTN